ncbi:MAG: endonuclease III [Firmicutes bacterium]|nr:endonuclease III [Bacillota bacterium]
MDKKAFVKEVLKRLKKIHPDAKIALHYKTPIELLVSTILSAQCTDTRVNIVTKDLFKKYRTPKDFASANLKEFEEEIRSTGFYHNKAKNIIAAANKIVKDYNGAVPDSMEKLITLPGVARKTANVVLQGAFGKSEGIVIDTHVFRVTQRLGVSKEKQPEKMESELIKIVPEEQWRVYGDLLIFHGRRVCMARKPNCTGCILNDICPSAFKV